MGQNLEVCGALDETKYFFSFEYRSNIMPACKLKQLKLNIATIEKEQSCSKQKMKMKEIRCQ